ncbi:MAG: APC family permease, partial [Leuconostoc fallax]
VTLANISGEIKNPRQTLPKAIVLGIVLVIFAYVGVTYGVYQSLPANQIISFGENATLRVAQEAFGEFGGRLLSITILVSLLGTLNGKVVSFPRVLFAMANEGIFPFAKTFAKINMRSRTPNAAIWLMIMIAIVMMAVADPNRLSDIAIFTTFLFYIMAFVGVIKLRRHNTMGVKPGFSTPFFPMIPLVAIAGSLYVEISEIYYDFYGVVISLLIVAVGYPIYLYLKRH